MDPSNKMILFTNLWVKILALQLRQWSKVLMRFLSANHGRRSWLRLVCLLLRVDPSIIVIEMLFITIFHHGYWHCGFDFWVIISFSQPRPSGLMDAMVADTGTHLSSMQVKRDSLEGMISEGRSDGDIQCATQALAKAIKDYKSAAAHVRKHCVKPKKAKEPGAEAAGNPGASAWTLLTWNLKGAQHWVGCWLKKYIYIYISAALVN